MLKYKYLIGLHESPKQTILINEITLSNKLPIAPGVTVKPLLILS